MRANTYFSACAACSLLVHTACAHELATHGLLTYEAYQRSVLASDTLLKDLGLDSIKQRSEPFGITYYDVSGTDIKPRTRHDFEDDIIKTTQLDPSTFPGWLLRGAIREDDSSTEQNPQDDPYSYNDQLRRPLHHFFDPFRNRPLDVLLLWTVDSNVHKAPDWAVGTDDVFVDSNTRGSDPRNHFTVFDAREAMWQALTGKQKDGTTDAGLNNQAVTESDRKAYWATTFRALGDVLHLNQDMSQPQHTRNEPHSGIGSPVVQDFLTGHSSFFEKYLDARAKRAPEFTMDNTVIDPVDPLVSIDLTGYPIPTFRNYKDFWSTNPGPVSPDGKGLADYSNQGFFTVAHNMDNTEYPFPPTDPNAYTVVSSTVTVNGHVLTINDFERPVPDSFTGVPSPPIHMTTQGIWNGMLGQVSEYTLNRSNYDDMAALLLPRAVAYSAGLINYFFRGRLSIAPPDEGVYGIVDHEATNQSGQGFKTIKLKIQNITPNGEAMGDGSSQGMLVAVVKYHLNTCYNANLGDSLDLQAAPSCYDTTENITTSAKIPVTSIDASKYVEYTFDFSQKPVPINALDLSLQVVYRGKLGNESDAVVVATKRISGPTFFSFFNDTDYFCLNGGWQKAGSPSLTSPLDFDHDNQPDMADQAAPIDINFRFGPSSAPVGTVTALPAGRYSRVAVLTDVPLVAPFDIEAYTSKSVPFNPLQLYYWAGAWSDPSSSEFELDTATKSWISLSPLGQLRGTNYFKAMEFFNYYPDNSCSTSALPAASNLSPYQVSKLPF